MRPSDVLRRYAPPVYRLHTAWRAAQVDHRISSEQLFYERAFVGKRDTSPLIDRIAGRLASRGHKPVKKPLADLHILYATRPSNWELHNIPPEIERLCHLTTYYYSYRGFNDESSDWLQIRGKMDEDLLAFVAETHAKQPIDLFFSYLSGWQVSPETIRKIGKLGIVTCGFHLDDKLSFRGIHAGGRWAGPAALASAYDLNLTNAPSSIIKYEVEGGLAVFWPEAANPEHYKPLNLPFEYDVNFIGACYGYRPILINYLYKNGVKVKAFGPGWPNGPVSEDQMVKIYSKSRINLGFGGIGYSMKSQCLKGRDFEVPMSGALYLTSHNHELEMVYDMPSEIVTYTNNQECLRKIQHLLKDEKAAQIIRERARKKCLKNHTWNHRIMDILKLTKLIEG